MNCLRHRINWRRRSDVWSSQLGRFQSKMVPAPLVARAPGAMAGAHREASNHIWSQDAEREKIAVPQSLLRTCPFSALPTESSKHLPMALPRGCLHTDFGRHIPPQSRCSPDFQNYLKVCANMYKIMRVRWVRSKY